MMSKDTPSNIRHPIGRAANLPNDESTTPAETRMTLRRRIARLIGRIARASRLASM